MDVHENVILDLLPIVRNGQASAESRALVDVYLEAHPRLARYAALLPTPDPALELRALRRTRQRLNRSSWLMALAIFLTFFPLSFIVDDQGLRFLFPQHTLMMLVFWPLALGLWIAYFLDRSGLRRPR